MRTATQSPDRASRIKRIQRRGCSQVIEALDRGTLGIKTLERLSKLPVRKQLIELSRLLEERKAKAERQAAWRANPRRGVAVFASQSYAEARARRLRKIQRRATAELAEAYSQGRLSLRQYDLLSRLSAQRQRKAVSLDRNTERAQSLAAATICSVLARKAPRIDLDLIASKIIDSIRSNY